MSVTYKVHRQSGTYIRPTLAPANRKAQGKFGVLDAAIIAVFLVGAGALFFLLGRG